MKWVLPLAVLLMSCQKEPLMISASIEARCEGCVVTRTVGGVSHVDTITWNIDHSVEPHDTVSGWAKWNTMVEEGAIISVQACTLDSMPTSVSIWTNGTLRGSGTSVYDCASAQVTAHQ